MKNLIKIIIAIIPISFCFSCNKSQWKNKRCIQLGDSITQLDGVYKEGLGVLKGYKTYMKTLGFKTIDNYALSSASIASQDPHLDPTEDICIRVDRYDYTKYDVVTVAGGTNDFDPYSSPLGEFKDKDFDKKTFIGACQYIVEKILSINSHIKIVLFTPLPRKTMNVPNSSGLILKDYAKAITQVGERYNLSVLDLFNKSGLNSNNFDMYTFDGGLHPNNAGYKFICENALLPFFRELKIN